MRNTSITSQSSKEIVTLTQNVTNVATPVMKVSTPRGATYRLHNTTAVRGGLVSGTYLILDLCDSSGDRISGASRVLIASRGPASEFPTFHRALPYSIWRDLTTTQQRNEDYKATLVSQSDLNVGAGIEVPEGHELQIFLESPQIIDWEKSFVQFDVEEVN